MNIQKIEKDKELKSARFRFRMSLLLLAAGILYAAFPIDLIPDILGPIGWVDDIGVLLIAFVNAFRSYRRMKRASAKSNLPEAQSKKEVQSKKSEIITEHKRSPVIISKR